MKLLFLPLKVLLKLSITGLSWAAFLVTSLAAHNPKEITGAVRDLSQGRTTKAHATLRKMDPAELEEYLNNEGGRAVVSKFFPGQTAEETLGAHVPRTKFNSEEDQHHHESRTPPRSTNADH